MKNFLKTIISIFTLGSKFRLIDFTDRLKKYTVEGIGIFIVISFSFYVENSGVEYGVTQNYLQMLNVFKKDLKTGIDHTLSFENDLSEELKWYKDQIERWEIDDDSIFIDSIEDEDEKIFFPPLGYFDNYAPFKPTKRGYNLFQDGGVDFELINSEISNEINRYYDDVLWYLEENSTSYTLEINSEFMSHVQTEWAPKLKDIDLFSNDFWIKNRKFIQADSQLKFLVKRKISLWEDQLYMLEDTEQQLDEIINKVDSVISDMEDDFYFIYWKLF